LGEVTAATMTAHICALLSSAAAQCDGLPMLTCGSRKATARQVASRVAALTVGLQQRLELKVGAGWVG